HRRPRRGRRRLLVRPCGRVGGTPGGRADAGAGGPCARRRAVIPLLLVATAVLVTGFAAVMLIAWLVYRLPDAALRVPESMPEGWRPVPSERAERIRG